MPQQHEESGFWDDERPRAQAPSSRRVRRAHSVAPRSVQADRTPVGFDDFAPALFDPEAPHPFDPPPRRGRSVSRPTGGRAGLFADPFWRRLGALVAVGVVAAPVAFVVRGSGPESARLQAAPAASGSLDGSAAADNAQSGNVLAATDGAATLTNAAAGGAVAADVSTDELTGNGSDSAGAVAEPGAAAGEQPLLAFKSQPQVQNVDVAARNVNANAVTATSTTSATCVTKYTVAASDFWIAIARKFGVKVTDLLAANKATVNTPLYPGRSICLPKGASTSATTAPTTTVKGRAATPTTVKSTTTTVKSATTTTVHPKAPPAHAPTTTPTTVAPTTTTTTIPLPPKNTYTKAQVVQIIRDIWPDDLEDQAIAIATRESNLIPTASNSCCFGLFQIYFQANRSSLAAWGITSAAQLYDPKANAYAAYAMYLRAGGWGPWRL